MIEKKTIFDFSELINFRDNQIISKILHRSEDAMISLFSFSENESVSEQANSEDIFIFVLEGEVEVTHSEIFTAKKGQILVIAKGTLHRVYSKAKSKVLQMSLIVNKKEKEMEQFIKKVNQREVLDMADIVSYEDGGISSIALVQRESLTLTIFAFDKGQRIASHSSNGDALVQVLDGEVTIDIDGTDYNLIKGQSIIMPAGTPHAVTAKEKFKMMLTVVKPL